MAEVTRRRTGEHLRTLFDILLAHPDGLPARDALAALENRMSLTPYEQGTYDSGGRRFEKIVRFSTIDCVKAGWLLKQKGRWSVTEEGRKAHEQLRDPETFYREAVSLFQRWKKAQPDPAEGEDEGSAVAEPGKGAAVTLEEAVESAWGEIDHYLSNMNPYDFQDLVGALLRGLGYHIAWTAPPGKDGGIDLVATPDALGIGTPRIKVQVKRQQATVSVDGLRSFMAMLGHDDVGLFVSLGGFTKDARDEARLQQTRKVTLIDIERLYDLWVEHYPNLPDEDRRRLPLQPIYFLAPE
jgi:restriction system protein